MAKKIVAPVEDTGNAVKDLKGDSLKESHEELDFDIKYRYLMNCPPIDIPYGVGICSGRIYEVFGWEGVAKTTLVLEMTKAVTNYFKSIKFDNYVILWIESESTIDKIRAHWIGCDMSKFLFKPAETIEDGHEELRRVLTKAKTKGTVVFSVWDTIAATSTRKEKEDGASMADKAKLGRKMLRDITQDIGITNSNLIFINQCHMGIGQFASSFETPVPAIKFYSSVRTLLKVGEKLQKELPNGTLETYGTMINMLHVKNKITKPHQTSQAIMMGETGLDILATNFRFINDYKLLKAAGGWKSLDIPEKLFDKSFDKAGPDIDMIEAKWQGDHNNPRFKAKVKEYPHMIQWMEYIIYRYYTNTSPVIKVRIIDKVWEYENLFYGCPITNLSQEEIELAKMLDKDVKSNPKLPEKVVEVDAK